MRGDSADLVAETGITVFRRAFERWTDDPKKHDLAHYLRAVLAELRVVAGTGAPASLPASSAKKRRAHGR